MFVFIPFQTWDQINTLMSHFDVARHMRDGGGRASFRKRLDWASFLSLRSLGGIAPCS